MGKNRKYQYREMNKLPSTAMTVSQYANSIMNCNTSYIYELVRKSKEGKIIDFEIVTFKGINFVIPLT